MVSTRPSEVPSWILPLTQQEETPSPVDMLMVLVSTRESPVMYEVREVKELGDFQFFLGEDWGGRRYMLCKPR